MTKPIAVVQSCSAVLNLDAKKWIKQTMISQLEQLAEIKIFIYVQQRLWDPLWY